MYRRLWSIAVSEVEAEASVLELRLSILCLLCGLGGSISTARNKSNHPKIRPSPTSHQPSRI